jgi:hypothetical protein
MWKELGGLFEEGLDGVVEASEVGVWGAGHCEDVDFEVWMDVREGVPLWLLYVHLRCGCTSWYVSMCRDKKVGGWRVLKFLAQSGKEGA